MTSEKIESVESVIELEGEALDLAVAQQIMGYQKIYDSILGEMWLLPEDEGVLMHPLPFSSKKDAAEQVIEKMVASGKGEETAVALASLLNVKRSSQSGMDLKGFVGACRPTPAQICKAALLQRN